MDSKYVTPGGYPLGAKLANERQKAQRATYPSGHRATIEAIWPGVLESVWDAPFKKLCARLKAFHDANPTARTVPVHHVEPDEYPLRIKFRYVSDRIRSGKYPPERRKALVAIWPEAFAQRPNQIHSPLNKLRGAADEVADLLLDATERQWYVTQPGSGYTYTLRLVHFGLREGNRFKHRGTAFRLVVQHQGGSADDRQIQPFKVLGPDTMKLGKVVMRLRPEGLPGAGEAFVAAEFPDHAQFWHDLRAALKSTEARNMPAPERHQFERLVQRATRGIASHARATAVPVTSNGSAQVLLTQNGISNGANRSKVVAKGKSAAKQRPAVKQLVVA